MTALSWLHKQTRQPASLKAEESNKPWFDQVCIGLLRRSSVYLEGKLKTRKWQDQSGNDRYTTEIICDQMQMLGGQPQAQGNGYQKPAQNNQPQAKNGYLNPPQNHQPQAQSNGYQKPSQNNQAYNSMQEPDFAGDDGCPF